MFESCRKYNLTKEEMKTYYSEILALIRRFSKTVLKVSIYLSSF